MVDSGLVNLLLQKALMIRNLRIDSWLIVKNLLHQCSVLGVPFSVGHWSVEVNQSMENFNCSAEVPLSRDQAHWLVHRFKQKQKIIVLQVFLLPDYQQIVLL